MSSAAVVTGALRLKAIPVAVLPQCHAVCPGHFDIVRELEPLRVITFNTAA